MRITVSSYCKLLYNFIVCLSRLAFLGLCVVSLKLVLFQCPQLVELIFYPRLSSILYFDTF